MEKEKYKYYMLGEIKEFLNKLVCEVMDKEGVEYGDIYPEQEFELNDCCESIVDIMLEVVEQNKDDND